MAVYAPAPAKPVKAIIDVQAGAWVSQEYCQTLNGDIVPYGPIIALETVAAPAGEVALSGTKTAATLTVKAGVLVQSTPHLATIQWRLPIANLTHWSNTMGATHDIRITCDNFPNQINSFLGLSLVAPSGSWDSNTESISGIALGYGNTAERSTKHFVGVGNWATLAADNAITQFQALHCSGAANTDKRAMSATTLIQSTHQTAPTTTPTYLYLTAFAITATLLADCVYTNPRITIRYGE